MAEHPLATTRMDGETCRLSELASEPWRLEAWLDQHQRTWPGTDRKAAGAFLVGGLVRDLLRPLVEALLADGNAGARWPGPAEVAVGLGWARWEHAGASGWMIAHRVIVDPPGGPEGGRPGDGLRRLVAPLVAAVAARTGLPPCALWRLVADSAAQACLEAGRARGDAGAGMALARDLLGDKGSPLHNRQWGFVEIEAQRPDGRVVRDWAVARGGCCRFHTVEGGQTCATCVLRDPGSRDALLRDWLATRPDAS
ncbi:(2Fe-2S)-binding protein [Rubellimicrobium aerolatum]|uniref:(2Fe-2S)-binding protein n=1 Tax=Rubellimicrobium aerolatum TaxID=490979 RepID=A0ABW0SGY4_9RHOB|nr:(2Fe-2S)-binding protein [Rubellimicrobium aerolatum]MBP1807535.1 hypothetical protein [Rubellimicrobium aerolatum]